MLGIGYYSRYAALRGPFRSGLLFLFHLAWKSRIRLPVLIAIGFMVLDIRMQLEINIDMGRGRRQNLPGQNGQDNLHQGVIDLNDTESELADTSYEGSETESYSTDSYTMHSGFASGTDEDENEVEDRNDNLFHSSCPHSNSGEDNQFSRKE